jgi:hypothetical protein
MNGFTSIGEVTSPKLRQCFIMRCDASRDIYTERNNTVTDVFVDHFGTSSNASRDNGANNNANN